jgi:hypothetical protein
MLLLGTKQPIFNTSLHDLFVFLQERCPGS